jgi:RNA polymerase sigma-70 factor (ECF subfamily)
MEQPMGTDERHPRGSASGDPPAGRGAADDLHARFLSLHMAHQGTLFGYLLTAVRDFQRAEDLLQQVSLVLWKKFSEYRPDAPWLPWAFGIARREVAKHFRDRGPREAELTLGLLDRVSATLAEESGPVASRRQALSACLEKLPPRQRELVRMRYEAGRSLDDLARALNRTAAAVNMILVRIRRALLDCTRRTMTHGT